MNSQAWIDYALKEGFGSFEIYEATRKEKNITWYEGSRDTFVTSNFTGIALRGIYKGKMLNFSTENTSDEEIPKTIELMKAQADAITSEDEEVLRSPEKNEEVKNPRTFKKADSETVNSTLKEIEKKLKNYDERIIQVSDMEYTEQTQERHIVNSLGLEIKDSATINALFASIAVQEGEDIKTDYDYVVIEDLKDIDADKFVETLANKTLSKLNATSLSSNSYPVIIDHKAMTMLFSVLSPVLFSGDLISKGISPLKDKLNTKIFSEKIKVIDNPRYSKSLNIYNYDDEGCPTREKVIVEDGVFKEMLLDTKSANRVKKESTGNGFKNDYDSKVSVSPRNCYIEDGEKSFEELLKDMNEGLVIDTLNGLHAGIDYATTNFSLQASGYYVKDGKKDHAVSLITVAGNFLDMMKDVVEVANDTEWRLNSIATPSIYFKSLAISGE